MTPNELWTAIQANSDCAVHIVPAEPKATAAAARSGDQAIADILNAAGVGNGSRAVDVYLAKKWLVKKLKWRGICDAASNPTHQAREAAWAAVEMANDARMTLDFLDPDAQAQLAALEAASLISAADRAALEALSFVPSAISAEDVSRAVRGPLE